MFSSSGKKEAERIKKKIGAYGCSVMGTEKQTHWKSVGFVALLMCLWKAVRVHLTAKTAMMLHFYNDAIFKHSKEYKGEIRKQITVIETVQVLSNTSYFSTLWPFRLFPSYLWFFIVIFSIHEFINEGFILVNFSKANSAVDKIEGVTGWSLLNLILLRENNFSWKTEWMEIFCLTYQHPITVNASKPTAHFATALLTCKCKRATSHWSFVSLYL